MRILVTGGTGFVGSNIAKALLERGDEVLITGHDAEQRISGFSGKLLQPSFLGLDWDAIPPLDALVHEAAINDTQSKDEREMMRANVDSTLALFDHTYVGGCRRFVFASSTAIYGDGPTPYREDQELHPLTPYAVSKLKMEEAVSAFGAAHTDAVIVGLRYCNVYGPGESHKGSRASMVYQIARQMQIGDPRLFKDGEQKRDYLYVKDAVAANLAALDTKQSTIVNCGSGTATSFNEVVKILNRELGQSRVPRYFENPYKTTYQNHTECDMSAAKNKIGFVPAFSIEEGIKDALASGLL